MNLIKAYIIKYLKIPLMIIMPYLLLILIQEVFFRMINYDFLNENKHYSLILNYNENIFINYIELISYEIYSTFQKVIPSGLVEKMIDFPSSMSKNLLFNIGLTYMIYCSISITLFVLLINTNFLSKYLKRLKIDQDVINRVNDKNGDSFREYIDQDIRLSPYDIELKLLFTDAFSVNMFQLSIFLSFSFIVIPYLTHEYVFFVSKYISLPTAFFGINVYINSFITSMILELSLLSITFAMFLLLIFFKNNLVLLMFNKFIIKNFILLYNIEKEKTNESVNTIMRLKEFNNPKLERLFLKKTNQM